MMSHQIQVPPLRNGQLAQGGPDYSWLEEPPHDEFTNVWDVLAKRWRVGLAIFLGFVAIVFIITLVMPKTYTATTKLIGGDPSLQNIKPNDTILPVLNALVGNSSGPGRSPETYVELMQEAPVAQRVIADLHLDTTPEQLLTHITAKPVTNTNIISLAVS